MLNGMKHRSQGLPEPLRTMCLLILEAPSFADGYGSAIDSEHPHHAYRGGLVMHTWEVLEGALGISSGEHTNLSAHYRAPVWQPDDRREIILTVAAIFHDCMKVMDYDKDGKKTEYRRLVRHLAGGYAQFEAMAELQGLQHDFMGGIRIQIGHCLLSHHGRQAWGATTEPLTPEAHILHYADMMSMQFGVYRGKIYPST